MIVTIPEVSEMMDEKNGTMLKEAISMIHGEDIEVNEAVWKGLKARVSLVRMI